MKLLDECANVILTGSQGGPAGSSLPFQFTFYLDLRTVIGNQMYDNYDYFGICLNSIGLYSVISGYVVDLFAGGTLQSPGGAALKLRIQGLPVVDVTTNGTINSISSGTYFPSIFTPGGAQGTGLVLGAFRLNNFPNTRKNVIMFSKPKSSFVTITLSVRNTADLRGVLRMNNTTNPLQNTSRFSFSIFPAINEE
jgi:hypothetical protein